MTLTLKTNRLEEARANLIGQFQNRPNLQAFLDAFVQQTADLETALFQILTDTDIDNAVGVQLDGLGDIVGEERGGRNDAEYRDAIRVRILLNTSEGTAEELIAIIKGIDSTLTPEIVDIPPAAFYAQIGLTTLSTDQLNRLAFFIRKGRGAAIGSFLIFHLTDPPFQYDGAAGTGYDDGFYSGAIA